MNPEEENRILIADACNQLAKSDKGRDALFYLHAWFRDSGLRLDQKNKDLVRFLVDMAWHSHPGTVLECILDQLDSLPDTEVVLTMGIKDTISNQSVPWKTMF
jgi:hypothetical protein